MSITIPPKIYQVLKNLINGSIEDYEISLNSGNKKGEGFLGDVFFITLQDKAENGKLLNLAVKQALSDKNIRKFNIVRDFYLNEIYFYTKIWPALSNFQEQIPSKLRFNHIAQCYGVCSEDSHEIIALENLKSRGFILHNKKTQLQKEQMEFIFDVYGKYHAMSFAYKAKHPEEFSELTNDMFEVWHTFYENQLYIDCIKLTHEMCVDSLQPGVDDEVIKTYKNYATNALDLYIKSLVNGTYTAITHGDCWSNNMMFKYDESGKLMDLRFLDFQMTRVGSPISDLSYCLYSGGTREMFENLDSFLKIYHDSLSQNLKAFGCDPEQVYPMEALKNDWKTYCYIGLTMSFMVLRGKLAYDDEMVDFTDMANENSCDIKKYLETKYDEKAFKLITRDIILHFYKNGWL